SIWRRGLPARPHLSSWQACRSYLRLVQPPFRLLVPARVTPHKECVCLAIGRSIPSDDIPLCINSIAMGKNYAGDGDIDEHELPVEQNKTMLASILPNIETDDISFRTYACDPREYRIGKVDRAELLVGQLKAVKGRIAAEVRANNVRRVDHHGWERPCCAR